MGRQVSLYLPGDAVDLGTHCEAEVLAVCLRGNIDHPHVTYECCWWDGADRKIAWVWEEEIIDYPSHEKTRVDFTS